MNFKKWENGPLRALRTRETVGKIKPKERVENENEKEPL